VKEANRKEREVEEANRKEREVEEANRKERELEEASRKERELEEANRKGKELEEANRKEKEKLLLIVNVTHSTNKSTFSYLLNTVSQRRQNLPSFLPCPTLLQLKQQRQRSLSFPLLQLPIRLKRRQVQRPPQQIRW
jgi:hypothetical protein